LVAAWNFDEGSGLTAQDSSGHGYYGQLVDGAGWTSGQKGSAVSFDGFKNRVQGMGATPFEYTGGEMTFSVWYYPDSSDTDKGDILSKPWNGSGQYNYRLIREATNKVTFNIGGATSASFTTTGQMTPDAWNHITVTLSPDKSVKIYLNGLLDVNSSHMITNWTPVSANKSLSLLFGCIYPYGSGWAGNTTYCVKGRIDNVKIYNRALGGNDVFGLYSSSPFYVKIDTINAVEGVKVQVPVQVESNGASGLTVTADMLPEGALFDPATSVLTWTPLLKGAARTVNFRFSVSDGVVRVTRDLPVIVSPQNIALNKSYVLNVAPNYALCTDTGDITQLTDGQYVSGYFWTQPGTVGWQSKIMVPVTIDLGKSEPIAGFSLNTAAGCAGVQLPKSIYLLVSDDNINWHYAGDLAAMNMINNVLSSLSQYSLFRYKAHDLQTHGRYVKFMIAPTGPFLFLDEIEIYRGDGSLLTMAYPDAAITSPDDYFKRLMVTSKLRSRLWNDLDAVTILVNAATFSEVALTAIKNELAAILALIPSVQIPSVDTFSTIFPINDVHRRIFAVQAAVWRSQGLSPVTVWPFFRWDMLTPTMTPQTGAVNLSMSMMSNEFRAQAFNLSNAGDADTVVRFSIKGLPGGVNPSYITVHEVLFTDTADNTPVAAALPVVTPNNGQFAVTIPPGLTRQIWLTFHPADVPAGDYQGEINLEGDTMNLSSIPLRLKIYPFNFPDHPAFHLGGWDYTDRDSIYSVTPENRAAIIQNLKNHFVDSPWATNGVMPAGKYDVNGHMTQAPDSALFKAWIARWPNAPKYFIFSNVQTKFYSFDIGTPAFTQAVTEWINWWAAQIKALNINLGQVGLLIRDEPSVVTEDNIIIPYARVIRAAQPDIRIFEDVTWTDPSQATPELFEVSHQLSPNLPMWIRLPQSYRDFYLNQRDHGHELWFYSCSGSTRLLDPYTYNLTSAWFAWKNGVKGESFWAFADQNGSWIWNEYTVMTNYSFFFISKTGVTDGKHMEAIREGVEDYEYLKMLHDKVTALEAKGIVAAALTGARTLLNTAADRVIAGRPDLNKEYWYQPKDRTVSEQVRYEILEALMSLRAVETQTGDSLPGDVSGDGRVSMYDAALILKYALGGSLTTVQQSLADMNGDTVIDAADAAAIARKVLGLN
ncbi:MAG: LamG-like jellyroll fold domain-containing protein, partial [Candidatus Omnitrophota bacterium]